MNDLSGDALVEKANGVRTREDFAAFLHLLLRNLREHPEEWENDSLEHYLEGLCGFVGGMEGYCSNIDAVMEIERPNWRVLAVVLLAGRIYE